jgi:aldehyde dehydrogenase (NAD+)
MDINTQTTDIRNLLKNQRNYFDSGQTKDVAFRKDMLQALYTILHHNEKKILNALKQDLSKSVYEGYMTEFGLTLNEIRFVLKKLNRWARPRRVRTHYLQFPASSAVYPEPYGIALIISPWNYPCLLTMAPLIGSMAAGNCSIIKPSEYTPHTSAVIAETIGSRFDPDYIAVIEGDAQTSSALLAEPFDYIFFTGSAEVGKIVMAAAAGNLTPVTLELGGKSPCIIDRGIDLDRTARRLVSGKFINAGQTCIAPDYLFVHRSVKPKLVERLQYHIRNFYGDNPRQSPDYPRIVNEKHFDRLNLFLSDGNIICGGQTERSDLYIAPTLLDGISWEDPVMQEEIFGPILPVMTYDDLTGAISKVRKLPRPLALYFFSNSREDTQRVLSEISFGGGCINDTVLHVASPHLPFGGVGSSGIGSYHGKTSFETFSHKKSILKKPLRIDTPLRYPPFKNKLKYLKKLMH